MPLSLTTNVSLTRPPAARAALASSRTAPCAVNFTALSMRFSSAARSRTGSPTNNSGRSSATATSARRPLVSARAASVSPKASMRRRGRKTSCCRTSEPAPPFLLALAASMTSVVSEARCSALSLMPAAQRRSRSPRLELASNSPSARMPVSAVRMSWAKTASTASRRRAPLGRCVRRRAGFCGRFLFDPRSRHRRSLAPRQATCHGDRPNKTRCDAISTPQTHHAPDIARRLRRRRAIRADPSPRSISTACGRHRRG